MAWYRAEPIMATLARDMKHVWPFFGTMAAMAVGYGSMSITEEDEKSSAYFVDMCKNDGYRKYTSPPVTFFRFGMFKPEQQPMPHW
eukprot:CAMPEP_0177628356 /NCGR_PEP_ID=MMETSP0447-20121125/87_1 /TAXON_ID=0 /ORGANISM="Stygamoeba regulata, Strain BSH-02190019" /LENGTH=85 /DNA_ID=CAMNT_0019129597 /DNA_START=38 /DNA_END=292 /DNA_ORIENTATION=+